MHAQGLEIRYIGAEPDCKIGGKRSEALGRNHSLVKMSEINVSPEHPIESITQIQINKHTSQKDWLAVQTRPLARRQSGCCLQS